MGTVALSVSLGLWASRISCVCHWEKVPNSQDWGRVGAGRRMWKYFAHYSQDAKVRIYCCDLGYSRAGRCQVSEGSIPQGLGHRSGTKPTPGSPDTRLRADVTFYTSDEAGISHRPQVFEDRDQLGHSGHGEAEDSGRQVTRNQDRSILKEGQESSSNTSSLSKTASMAWVLSGPHHLVL